MDPHPGSEHKIDVMLPWTLVYFRCLSKYRAPYVGSKVAGQEGHFIFSRDLEGEGGDVDEEGGGNGVDGLSDLLVCVARRMDDKDDGGVDDGAEVYLDLSIGLVGELCDTGDGCDDGAGGELCDTDNGRDDVANVYLDP